jgi:hypothetical protein
MIYPASPSDAPAPPSAEVYLNSPEYLELRGISGKAVAAKATYLGHPVKRKLLHFLQRLSLEQRGFSQIAKEILEWFGDRLGSPTMHEAGIRPSQRYNADQVRAIRDELGLLYEDFPLKGETARRRTPRRTIPA